MVDGLCLRRAPARISACQPFGRRPAEPHPSSGDRANSASYPGGGCFVYRK
jgi:hypothetical protein